MRKHILNKESADFDILVDSFRRDLEISNICNFPNVIVYKNTTRDYPGKYVARLFDIRPGEVIRTRYIMLSDDPEVIRKEIPLNMHLFQPDPKDDLVILEVWI